MALPTVGRQIKLARLAKNWTQQELAARSGVSLNTVNRYENGGVEGGLVLAKIAGALELELDPLLDALESA